MKQGDRGTGYRTFSHGVRNIDIVQDHDLLTTRPFDKKLLGKNQVKNILDEGLSPL
jgi:hypothetical protein